MLVCSLIQYTLRVCTTVCQAWLPVLGTDITSQGPPGSSCPWGSDTRVVLALPPLQVSWLCRTAHDAVPGRRTLLWSPAPTRVQRLLQPPDSGGSACLIPATTEPNASLQLGSLSQGCGLCRTRLSLPRCTWVYLTSRLHGICPSSGSSRDLSPLAPQDAFLD